MEIQYTTQFIIGSILSVIGLIGIGYNIVKRIPVDKSIGIHLYSSIPWFVGWTMVVFSINLKIFEI